MGVNTAHARYNEWSTDWTKCRDVIAGSKAVKAKGKTYLPMHQFEEDEYEDYKDRALFFNATARTKEGFTGLVFRRPPVVSPGVYPSDDDDHWTDITLTNVSLPIFAKQVFNEVVSVGRCGVLLEAPQEAENPRPYWCLYRAEDIVNWREVRLEGRSVLTRVVLRETYDVVDENDPFKVETGYQFRELSIDDDGVYRQRIWQKVGKEYQIVEEIEPRRKAAPMGRIPFVFFGPDGNEPDIVKPPLLDIIEVNLSHYRTSADLEHARHWSALPMLALFGFPEDTHIDVGSSVALICESPDGRAEYIELVGRSIPELREALEEKKQQMATIGMRLLAGEDRKVAESAEHLNLLLAGEQSTLTSIGSSVSDGLTKCLTLHLWWMGDEAPYASFELNSDFIDRAIPAQKFRELVIARQAGEISRHTFVYNLKRGEVLPPDWTIEDELEALGHGDESMLESL